MKRKIIIAMGFTPFYENNAQAIIQIDNMNFTLMGKETRELAPYPCMQIEEKHFIETIKEIFKNLQIEDCNNNKKVDE